MLGVDSGNFVRAETARMSDGVLARSGGVSEWAPNPG
jgi:hypothetical protein